MHVGTNLKLCVKYAPPPFNLFIFFTAGEYLAPNGPFINRAGECLHLHPIHTPGTPNALARGCCVSTNEAMKGSDSHDWFDEHNNLKPISSISYAEDVLPSDCTQNPPGTVGDIPGGLPNTLKTTAVHHHGGETCKQVQLEAAGMWWRKSTCGHHDKDQRQLCYCLPNLKHNPLTACSQHSRTETHAFEGEMALILKRRLVENAIASGATYATLDPLYSAASTHSVHVLCYGVDFGSQVLRANAMKYCEYCGN